ncbi:hypothetical protein SAMN05428959_102337 [Duganella sp. CF517]|uniref:hypothetical protein n=1 Tax=Duganella sp. CF517 TaxID=1881038 RepID=UPI0008ACAE2C|nr:hypothetical protein [Duganella sp. CF517]SEN54685.1 hypothetical protein SAMN05428959_102337 [Duganella sp. CF517]
MTLGALLAGWVVLCVSTHALAAKPVDPCPRTSSGDEWSARCFIEKGGERKVKPRYLKRIEANGYGMAVIVIEQPREMVAVNRQGIVVVPNIRHTGDFDYPTAERGIGRFAIDVAGDGRRPVLQCGYFKAEQFRIVVPAQYDHCAPFRQGEAQACRECVSYCTDEDCHDRVYVGGEGAALAPNGEILRTYTLPGLDKVCGAGQVAQTRAARGGGTLFLNCKTLADPP